MCACIRVCVRVRAVRGRRMCEFVSVACECAHTRMHLEVMGERGRGTGGGGGGGGGGGAVLVVSVLSTV